MDPRLLHPPEDVPPAVSGGPPGPSDVASWAVAPGDTVVVRGTFTREEIRAYVGLVERLHPDAGLTVVFMPPGVGLERIARMVEGWRGRAADAR